jgi:hypothetical protein
MSSPASPDDVPKPRRLLGQILKVRGVVREGDVQRALGEQRKHGGLIGQHLVALSSCTAADVAAALAEQAGLDAVDLERVEPAKEALARIDASTAHAYGVLPLSLAGRKLVVAIGDPLNTAVLEDLAFTTGLEVRDRGALTPEVKSYLVFVEALMRLWKKARGNKNKTMFACPEMGPYAEGGGGYNITGLPPAWPDAVVLRGELASAWKKA